jgi:hypothetical protein
MKIAPRIAVRNSVLWGNNINVELNQVGSIELLWNGSI